ncbi:hypothetical protein DL96DRAFT_1716107 [Flagelloscypha sp. PMI_526]|nr:hypothetical protein DL96DRAFT_1716107 [Flagelloscypha sp. PMI_526]
MVAAPPSPPPTSNSPLAIYKPLDLTTHIGTQFENIQVSTLLQSDEHVRSLAELVSHRGVVFFKNQDLNIEQQKHLALKMSNLTGKKDDVAGLHRHPISEETSELGAEVSIIDSMGGIARAGFVKNTRASNGWHADITFENVPSDFTMLKMHTLPPVGGDTLWASAYDAYDRLSPAYQKFLEGLTAKGKNYRVPRGHPDNNTEHLTAIHPLIRTHPVTGFKALFVNKSFTQRIVELGPDESASVLDFLFRHVSENHDLQVRFRWEVNDLAIWDNRCTWHTATNDYTEHRRGDRVVTIGERPYLDPLSKSRREVLGISVP